MSSQFQYGSNAMSGWRDDGWKLLTNQRPAFGRQSLEHDGTHITSEGLFVCKLYLNSNYILIVFSTYSRCMVTCGKLEYIVNGKKKKPS